jgi:hypothetical protein
MKPEAILFALAVATPVLAHVFCRNALLRLGLSVILTVALMAACLVIGELRAQIPDFDITFGVALLGWGALAFAYVIICFVILSAITALIRRIWPKQSRPTDQKEPAPAPQP